MDHRNMWNAMDEAELTPTRAGKWLGRLWVAVCLAVGVGCVLMSWPGRGGSGGAGVAEAKPAAAQAFTAISPALASPGATAPLLAIQDVQVGDRVLAHNPQLSESERSGDGVEPDAANFRGWVKLTLAAEKADGGVVLIELLRSRTMVDAVPGEEVSLHLPEMGVDGPALLLAVEENPTIKSGSGRVVTGKFAHVAAQILNVFVGLSPEPIGTTAEHPFWSEDRQDFVSAGELKQGERLRTASGGIESVFTITERGPPEPVYNLEVDVDHVYHVGESGVLVHNNCANLRRSAVREAWRQERALLQRTGRGTRDWTDSEIDEILTRGKVSDYYGHHINSVLGAPHLAGVADNITFLTWAEHLLSHNGAWRNITTGSLINRARLLRQSFE